MRRNAVATFAANLVQYLDVREEVPVLWLKEAEYIAYFQRKQNLSMEAATEKWKRDKANSDIARRGEGEQLRLAVEAPPCTIATRGRRLERGISSQVSVYNQGDLQRQLEQVTGFGHADTFLTGQFGSAAEVLRTGATATTSERPTSAANAFNVQDDGAPAQATTVEAVLPTSLIPQDMPLAHPSRNLVRTRSEEAEDPEAKKPRRKKTVPGWLESLPRVGKQPWHASRTPWLSTALPRSTRRNRLPSFTTPVSWTTLLAASALTTQMRWPNSNSSRNMFKLGT